MDKVSEQLQYVTSDQVGKVIYQGLAALYDAQPATPTTFLANWLLNYSKTQMNEQAEQEAEKTKKVLLEKCEMERQDQANEQQKQQEVEVTKNDVLHKFQRRLEDHLYLDETLPQEFPEFLKQNLNVPAVYIGHHNYLRKEIAEDDEELDAHLDKNQEKTIQYIGCSKGQEFLLKSQLPTGSGVTYDALKPKEDEDQGQQPDEEGEENASKPPKSTYVYVPDVTQEPRMTFFRIPKLGAYVTCPLVYKSVLSEAAFDEGVKERLRVQQETAEQQKEKESKDAEYQQRIDDAEDQGLNSKDIEDEWKNVVWEEIKEKDFLDTVNEFVVCADTLGEDREIPEEQRKSLEEWTQFFVDCWQNSEKKQLSQDIDRQIKYLQHFNKEEFLKEFGYKMEDDVNEKLRDHRDQDNSELVNNYTHAVAKTDFLIDAIVEPESKNHLLALRDYRVVKFLGIIQNALFLVGYSKEQVNVSGTNLVNWKIVSHMINDTDFFNKLTSYQYKGPKEQKPNSYAKPQRILKSLEKFVLEEVDEYNIGLGVLLRFLRQVLEARVLDVEVRRADAAARKTKRERLIEEAEALKVLREQAIEQARAQVQEGEEFDEEEWEKEWEDNNPPIEIPDEVVDEIDIDLEQEAVEA